MQPATARALTVEVLVRQPCYETINRNECGHAQPATDVEQWHHREREQQE